MISLYVRSDIKKYNYIWDTVTFLTCPCYYRGVNFQQELNILAKTKSTLGTDRRNSDIKCALTVRTCRESDKIQFNSFLYHLIYAIIIHSMYLYLPHLI